MDAMQTSLAIPACDKSIDAFSIPTLPSQFDTESIISYSNHSKKEIKKRHKPHDLILSMPLDKKSYDLKPDLTNEYIKPNATTSNVAEESTCDSNIYPPLFQNKLKRSKDFDDDDSVTTARSSNSMHERNNPMMRKAIDIFNSNIHNYLQGIMRKASYSPSETTEHSIEYVTFLAQATNSEIDRIEDFKSNCEFYCSSNNSIPPKKRRHQNSSNI